MNLKSEEIKKMTISPQTPLKIAMRLLNDAAGKTLFIVDNNDKLIGSITDGDIRRAIISGVGFEQLISNIMFKSPRFVRRAENAFDKKAKNFVHNEKLYAIPILDETDRIVDVFLWHDFFEYHPLSHQTVTKMKNPVVIMAGGKGARLDPFTKILPKPLIPFGEKPIIEKIMDNFSKYGFENFILTLNYKKEIIKMYFKENQPAHNVEWVEEDEYLGTAGSLGLLKDRVKETFFVCNCDVILEEDFRNIFLWHKGEGALITLIGCHKEMTIPYGTLEINNGSLKSIHEKPTYDLIINTGVYIMEPQVLNFITPTENIDMNHLVERVLNKGKVSVYPVCGGWIDIGQWKDYNESLYLLKNGK